MLHNPRLFIAVFSLLIGGLTACAGGSTGASPTDAGAEQVEQPLATAVLTSIEDALDTHVGQAPGGVAVAIAVPGHTPYFGARGQAQTFEAISPQTVFQIGSITKEFTAAIILRASTEGRLELDDLLTDHLPSYPAPAPITLRHLLSHTSGLVSYTSVPGFGDDPEQHYSQEDILALFSTRPLQFAPGSAWQYSNSGYYLLGLVIEAVYAQPYADVVRAELLAPLGLEHTGYCDADEVTQSRAQGYTPSGVNAASINMSQPFSAGALCSTAEDVLTWHLALTSGEVTTAPFDTAVVTDDALPTTYGMGVFVGRNHWRPYVGHGGNINGFTARATLDLDSGITVVLLSNRHGDDLVGLEATLISLLVDERHEDRSYVPSQQEREQAVGTYARTGLPPIEIRDGANGLVGVFGSSPELPLIPVGPRDFSVDAANVRLRFVDGPSQLLEVEQFGMLLTLQRQPEVP